MEIIIDLSEDLRCRTSVAPRVIHMSHIALQARSSLSKHKQNGVSKFSS